MIFSDVSGVRALLGGIFTGPGSISRIITLLVILTNLKVFPFVWHVSYASMMSLPKLYD